MQDATNTSYVQFFSAFKKDCPIAVQAQIHWTYAADGERRLMEDFQWMVPTEFVFGHGAEERIGNWVAHHNFAKALLIYGKTHAVKSGLVATIHGSLDNAGVEHVDMGGVRPNPEVSFVRNAIQTARDKEIDIVIAIGGGSVIDTCKAVAAGVLYDGDVWDLFKRPEPVAVSRSLPVVSVLTIPAAGSEASDSCVISNDALGLKSALHGDFIRCKAAFMDPELTLSLPAWQTFAGITDMCVHIFERFFSQTGDVPVSDGIALSLLRSIRSAALVLLRDPSNYDARATIMWASTLAHNGICGVGRVEDWASHGMEHELSAAKPEVTHGAGLAVIVPAWMRFVYHENPQRFAQLGREVFGLGPTGSVEADAQAAIDAVQHFFCAIGMPRYLDEFGFTRDDVDALLPSLQLNKGATFGSFKRLSIEDARTIYLSAFKPKACQA